MFSLIITVLAIGLVAILAFVGLYYGSTVASEAASRARAATLVNQGEQIVAAARLFYINNSRSAATLQELVDAGYLQSIPAPVGSAVASSSFSLISEAVAAEPHTWTWDSSTQTLSLVRAIEQPGVCEQVNQLSFNSRTIRDAVDARVRVQCYGTPDSNSYTLIWNANIMPDIQKPDGTFVVCDGTKNIGHVPATCGVVITDPPPPTTQGGDVLVFQPTDKVPGIDEYLPGVWGNDPADGTCSATVPATTATAPLQYVIYAPSEGLLSINMALTLNTQNPVDYYALGYNYGVGAEARVLVDGQAVYSQGINLNYTEDVTTTPTLVSAGTHVVTVDVSTTATLFDAYTWAELPWTSEVPAPTKKVCVKQFQNAIAAKPSTNGSVPPAGQLSLSGSCSMDSLPNLIRVNNFGYYCPTPGSITWGDVGYAMQFSNIVIRGTKETLDGLNPYSTNLGAIFLEGASAGTAGTPTAPSMTYVNRECASLTGTGSPYEVTQPLPLGSLASVRVSDTELWIPGTSGQLLRGNICQGSDCYGLTDAYRDQPYAQKLSLALLSVSGMSFGGPAPTTTTLQTSDVTCNVVSGRSAPLNSGGPTCATGFSWSESLSKCVCQPSATNTCATPNAPLPTNTTNTNPNVICVSGTLTSGKCFPWMSLGG